MARDEETEAHPSGVQRGLILGPGRSDSKDHIWFLCLRPRIQGTGPPGVRARSSEQKWICESRKQGFIPGERPGQLGATLGSTPATKQGSGSAQRAASTRAARYPRVGERVDARWRSPATAALYLSGCHPYLDPLAAAVGTRWVPFGPSRGRASPRSRRLARKKPRAAAGAED